MKFYIQVKIEMFVVILQFFYKGNEGEKHMDVKILTNKLKTKTTVMEIEIKLKRGGRCDDKYG